MERNGRFGCILNRAVLLADSLVQSDFQNCGTESGALPGTLFYMAPERISDSENTPAGDVYALGFIGYEMLSARIPFADKEPLSILKSIVTEALTPISIIRPDLSQSFSELIESMIEKIPALRPSIRDVISRLQEL